MTILTLNIITEWLYSSITYFTYIIFVHHTDTSSSNTDALQCGTCNNKQWVLVNTISKWQIFAYLSIQSKVVLCVLANNCYRLFQYIPRQAINMTIVTWQHMYKATCVLTLMAQCKSAATPVRQHWSYHRSTPSHQYDRGNRCIEQLMYSLWWPSASLQQPLCVSTGATTNPRNVINMTMEMDV